MSVTDGPTLTDGHRTTASAVLTRSVARKKSLLRFLDPHRDPYHHQNLIILLLVTQDTLQNV